MGMAFLKPLKTTDISVEEIEKLDKVTPDTVSAKFQLIAACEGRTHSGGGGRGFIN